MGADTEAILRLLQFFIDELGDDDIERDEDDRRAARIAQNRKIASRTTIRPV
jgi:hypothetical protein